MGQNGIWEKVVGGIIGMFFFSVLTTKQDLE
jgi:hypothetical protein